MQYFLRYGPVNYCGREAQAEEVCQKLWFNSLISLWRRRRRFHTSTPSHSKKYDGKLAKKSPTQEFFVTTS